MYGRCFERKFGVCGDPVGHSLSPRLFAAAYPQSDWKYDLFEVSMPQEAMALFHQKTLDGMNVTAPLKTNLLPYASILEPECRDIGATNLLLRRGDDMVAYNYDHVGVSASFGEAGMGLLHGAVCLLLGAGGAARAAGYAILKGGATLLWANRTIEHIPHSFVGCPILPLSLSHVVHHLPICDVIINTLPQPIPETRALIFHARQVVFDASYATRPLEEQALEAGAKYIGGERWLLHQAVPSFTAMTGVAPNFGAMEEVWVENSSSYL